MAGYSLSRREAIHRASELAKSERDLPERAFWPYPFQLGRLWLLRSLRRSPLRFGLGRSQPCTCALACACPCILGTFWQSMPGQSVHSRHMHSHTHLHPDTLYTFWKRPKQIRREKNYRKFSGTV